MTKNQQDEMFEELYKNKQKAVIGYCYRYTRNIEDAKDLAHSIFLSIYKNLPKFRGESQLSTWLYSSCRNACLNHVRAGSAYKRKGIELSIDDLLDATIRREGEAHTWVYRYLVDKKAPNALTEVCSREGVDSINKKISSMPKDYKEILHMFIDAEGLISYEDCAKKLKITKPAVRARLNRGRVGLREKLNR